MKRFIATAVLLLAAPASAELIGGCRFDRDKLTFAGSPVEQATCLLRKVELMGVKKPQPLPLAIARLMEQGGAPSAAQKAAAIAAFPEPYRTYALGYLDLPASQTEAGVPLMYFVIHDTSEPFMGTEPFPHHLNNDPKVNSFDSYLAAEPVAHIFLNRGGQIWAGHDFSQPWRATKLESFVVGAPAKGRFVHVETVQPRRFATGSQWHGDTLAPTPGFSDAQYRMLAALYVYASARAEMWLIPGFHNGVDAGIPEAHDDPQNFDLNRFGKELEKLLKDARHVSAA